MPVKITELAALFKAHMGPVPGPPPSKLDRLLTVFCEYAALAEGWDPTAEDDYKEFRQAIKEVLDAEA